IVSGVAAAQWGATLNCDGCHGGNAGATNKITTGQHALHTNNAVLGANLSCVECHANTVLNDTTIGTAANHMNSFAN
ncbi:hypothetical protein, partial [Geotalea toluenoxydans]